MIAYWIQSLVTDSEVGKRLAKFGRDLKETIANVHEGADE